MASILVVDDSSFQRQMIKTALVMGGFDTVEAANGEECLVMLQTHQPSCIFIDLLMPHMNGFQLLEKLNQYFPLIPVVIITADIQLSTKERCLELGAKMVLNKPIKKKELLNAVSEILNSN